MVKLSELTADTTVGGSEKVLALDGTTNKTITTDQLASYAIDTLVAAAEATPTTGDAVIAERSGTEQTLDLDDLADYALARGWSAASAADPAVSGDMVMVDRSGTIYEVDVDTLATFCQVGIQADVLDLSGLDTAVLTSSDLIAVCQTSTGKKATITALETLLWTDYATYVTGLTSATTPADADELYVLQSGVAKKLTLTNLSGYVVDEILAGNDLTSDILDYLSTYLAALDPVSSVLSTDLFYTTQSGTAKYVTLEDIATYAADQAAELPWEEVESSKYTATPASTSTITMTDTSDFEIGYPVKYAYGGTTYYGIVTAIGANALLTVAGAPMSVASALSSLHVGRPERVHQERVFVDTAFGDAVQDVLSGVTYERRKWTKADAYLVSFSGTLGVIDTGASQPKINVKVGSNVVSTTDTNKGITLAGSTGTWTDNAAVAVDSTKYAISRGDAVDVRCTEAGTNGDAACLSVLMTFVLE